MNTAPEESKPQPSRVRRRILRACLGFGVFVLVLITIGAILIVPKSIDEAPFDASSLELVIPEVPEAENAALAYMAIWEEGVPQLPFNNDRDVAFWDAAEAGGLVAALEADPELREEYWEPMLRMLTRLKEAGDSPEFQFPVQRRVDDPAKHLVALKDTAEALWFRSQWFSERGEAAELLQGLEDWARLSSHVSNGVLDALALNKSVAIAGAFSSNLGKQLSATSGDLRELLTLLGSIGFDRKQISTTLCAEFQIFRNTLAELKDAMTEDRNLIERWLYLPHQTERIYGEDLLAAIAEGEATGRVTSTLEIPDLDGWLNKLRVGNVLGWTFILFMSPNADSLYEKAGSANSVLRATELMVALVIYEEQHGELPAELEALVPEILPAIPRDPFDGKPIRYDQERRVVWAVGSNGTDEGGLEEPGTMRGADIVVAISKRGE